MRCDWFSPPARIGGNESARVRCELAAGHGGYHTMKLDEITHGVSGTMAWDSTKGHRPIRLSPADLAEIQRDYSIGDSYHDEYDPPDGARLAIESLLEHIDILNADIEAQGRRYDELLAEWRQGGRFRYGGQGGTG